MSNREGHAAVPNWMIRDKRVPRSAILVYASLSSRAGYGAIFPSQQTIAEESGLSVRTVRTMIGHLEDLGVVARHRRHVEGQRRATDGYTLHPNGLTSLPAEIAARSDLAANEARSTGNEQQVTPLIEIAKEEIAIVSVGFAEFYMAYPRKVGKEAARRAFEKAARTTSADVIVAGARRYAADPNLPERQFIPHPATWLNAGRWDDEPEAPRARPSTPEDVLEDFGRDEWMYRA